MKKTEQLGKSSFSSVSKIFQWTKSDRELGSFLPGKIWSVVESIEWRGVVRIGGRFSFPGLN